MLSKKIHKNVACKIKKINCQFNEKILKCQGIDTVKARNSNSDFSKFSLIRNEFQTQWLQRIGPIYELFQIISIKNKCFLPEMFLLRIQKLFDMKKNHF